MWWLDFDESYDDFFTLWGFQCRIIATGSHTQSSKTSKSKQGATKKYSTI